MNLQVNLILDPERRSASPLSPRSLARIATVLGPAVLGFFLLLGFVSMIRLNSHARALEAEWAVLQPRQDAAAKLKEQTEESLATLRHLEDWRTAKMQWHEQLAALPEVVPANIMLRSLRAAHTLQVVDRNVPALVYTLSLEGLAVGADPEHDVQFLRAALTNHPVFQAVIERSEIVKYDADPRSRTNRVFLIECAFHPRRFQ